MKLSFPDTVKDGLHTSNFQGGFIHLKQIFDLWMGMYCIKHKSEAIQIHYHIALFPANEPYSIYLQPVGRLAVCV